MEHPVRPAAVLPPTSQTYFSGRPHLQRCFVIWTSSGCLLAAGKDKLFPAG